MKKFALLFVAALTTGCGTPSEEPGATLEPEAAVEPAFEHQGNPLLADLADGWNRIHPGADTMCLYGTDYSYFVRPKDPENILIS
ncbi:MAG: hypothetical protein ACR2QQ_02865, partial [Gammaproteobacteria bacterium]